MSTQTRKDEKMDRPAEGTQEVEASGDAIVIADAIRTGLDGIAEAIRMVAREMRGEEIEDEPKRYMDGTPISDR